MVITNNILQRTFHLRHGTATGTGFTFSREGAVYLVTAKHMVSSTELTGFLEIYSESLIRP